MVRKDSEQTEPIKFKLGIYHERDTNNAPSILKNEILS